MTKYTSCCLHCIFLSILFIVLILTYGQSAMHHAPQNEHFISIKKNKVAYANNIILNNFGEKIHIIYKHLQHDPRVTQSQREHFCISGSSISCLLIEFLTGEKVYGKYNDYDIYVAGHHPNRKLNDIIKTFRIHTTELPVSINVIVLQMPKIAPRFMQEFDINAVKSALEIRIQNHMCKRIQYHMLPEFIDFCKDPQHKLQIVYKHNIEALSVFRLYVKAENWGFPVEQPKPETLVQSRLSDMKYEAFLNSSKKVQQQVNRLFVFIRNSNNKIDAIPRHTT